MKTTQKVLQFANPAEESETSPIVIQIGNERFAIHYEIQKLPPAPPQLRSKRPRKRGSGEDREVVPETNPRGLGTRKASAGRSSVPPRLRAQSSVAGEADAPDSPYPGSPISGFGT